jgi:hydroxymethylpyrimidine pyrophosphatase-like HAD family hydrolase/GTPase SAR1 family protein
MYFFALASDYDGTAAHDGCVASATEDAFRRLRESNRKLVLVTGRIVSDLLEVCPQISLFDCVVAENGAVIYWPEVRESVRLTEPVPPAFTADLAARGVKPLSVGEALVATWEPHEKEVLAAIRDQGLELQVIFNKGAVMVLPSGVNKGTGLCTALGRLGVSRHNTFGIGDAENDHAFLELCECSVAVANALPALRARADLTTRGSSGDGVVELINQVLRDEEILSHGLARHQLHLGTDRNGREITLTPRGRRVLICGGSGTGKSTIAMSLLEQLIEREYQCLLLDPEGDFDLFEGAVAFGTPRQQPDPHQILNALKDPAQNVIVNLIAVPLSERPGFLAQLYPMIEEMRAQLGRPHWLFFDETHHMMPFEREARWSQFFPKDCIMITVDPDSVARTVISSVDVLLATDDDSFRKFADVIGSQISFHQFPEEGEIVAWNRLDDSRPTLLRPQKSATRILRHRRKYAEGELPEDRSFYFRGADLKLNLRARNLQTFVELAEGIDDGTWLYHLHRGDYSRWIRSALKDGELADRVEKVEKAEGGDALESRTQIKAAIEERYTAPTLDARG